MAEEVIFRTAKKVRDEAPGNVFGLEGRAQLGPHDSKSAEIIIRFWDDSISKPLALSARHGLPPEIEEALSSLEPVKARFKIDPRRGLLVIGCQLPTANGKGWKKWQDV